MHLTIRAVLTLLFLTLTKTAFADTFDCVTAKVCMNYPDCWEGETCQVYSECKSVPTFVLRTEIDRDNGLATLSSDALDVDYVFDLQEAQPWAIAVGSNAKGETFNAMFTMYRNLSLALTIHVPIQKTEEAEAFAYVLNFMGVCDERNS